MTFLLRNSRRYEKVYYDREQDYEDVAKQQLIAALPSCWVFDFKPLVLGEEGGCKRPDLAIVDKAYRFWVVVEVELVHHSLAHHVRPQVEALVTGTYDEAHVEAAVTNEPALDPERTFRMARYVPPEIAVVVNCRSVIERGWTELEADLSARLTFLEVYRADDNDAVVSISGFLPEARAERLVSLKKDRMLNALVCSRPEMLPAGTAGTLVIFAENRALRWKVATTADSALLLPQGGVTVRSDRNYELLRSEDGRLRLELV